MNALTLRSFVFSCLAFIWVATATHAQLTVVSIDPPVNGVNEAPNTSIVVDFDRALSAATLSAVRVYGSQSGVIAGTKTLENGGTRLRFAPARPFFAGENVRVGLSHALQASDGTFLRQAGFVARFRVRTERASMSFTTIESFYSDPTVFTRVYGAQACDLDGDHYVDLAAVSEVSADVRVFKNLGDATGHFATTPASTIGVAAEPSPNDNADMNADGKIDIVTCDVTASSVSILFGNGDGTLQPAVTYSMGTEPHGMALLDANGDGAIDVATANYASNDMALRLNNGNGTLGPVSFFEGGGNGEWALATADMNGDGIEDLVVGMNTDWNIAVHLGNGDGTFAQQPNRNAGGAVWMLVCGDIDGDGKIDVACANGTTGNGSTLRGNGDGTLQTAQVVNTGAHTSATDLGDLDGDGDLDWVLSVFGGSEWRVYTYSLGAMHFQQSFPSSANPGCATLVDIDNDGDLDIVLLTETSDEIIVKQNGALDAQTFCYGTSASCPCGNGGAHGHGCEHSFATGGGLLNAQGTAGVANDSLTLTAGGLPPATSTLFFQGDARISGGAGSAFGDGLRCAGGHVLRIGGKTTDNGYASYGAENVGDVAISVRGAIPAAGATRYYQAWFRNNASFCTASTFNLTNGVRVAWTP